MCKLLLLRPFPEKNIAQPVGNFILEIRASNVRPDLNTVYISRATMGYFPVFNATFILTLLGAPSPALFAKISLKLTVKYLKLGKKLFEIGREMFKIGKKSLKLAVNFM
jgi:hypothetical protein